MLSYVMYLICKMLVTFFTAPLLNIRKNIHHWNQFLVALFSPSFQSFTFFLSCHMPFTDTCSCLRALSATSCFSLIICSLFLSFCITRRCTMWSFAQAYVVEELRTCAAPCKKNAAACANARANERGSLRAGQHLATHMHVHWMRTEQLN